MYFLIDLLGLHWGRVGISNVVGSISVRCFVVLFFDGHHWFEGRISRGWIPVNDGFCLGVTILSDGGVK